MSKKKGHGFSAEVFRKRQKRIVGKRMKGVDALYAVLADKVVRAMGSCDYDAEKDGDFSFSSYPGVEKKIDGLLNGFVVQMTDNINEGISESWDNGNAMNDALVSEMVSGARGMGAHIPRNTVNMWTQRNYDALAEFMMRKVNGMGLSGRIWDLTKQLKDELELALEVGIGDGKSAASLSRDVRGSLREPKRLFRRVRDKETGELRLSKAAAAYHPGRGKYRSSHKNAMRMTATETNMAYRTADYERRKQIPFILGIEINLSDNHPDEDICDSLKGIYPKDFKFTGWHPWCRCYTTSLLPSYEDMLKYMEDGTIPDGVIKDLPDNFNDWVKENEERIANAKSLPYFLKDNGVMKEGKWEYGKPNEKLSGTEAKKIETYGIADKALLPLSKQQSRKFDSVKTPTGVGDSALEGSFEKGLPMAHGDANKGNVNPAYKEGVNNGLNNNCAGCVMAYIARRNGYDVVAGARNNVLFEDLASHPERAWLTKEGNVPKFAIAGGPYSEKGKIVYKNREMMLSEFEDLTQKEGLYQIKYRPPVVGEGHTIVVERLSGGILMVYDGQNSKMYRWRDYSRIISNAEGIGILPLDGLSFNPEYVNVGLAKRGMR